MTETKTTQGQLSKQEKREIREGLHIRNQVLYPNANRSPLTGWRTSQSRHSLLGKRAEPVLDDAASVASADSHESTESTLSQASTVFELSRPIKRQRQLTLMEAFIRVYNSQ